jgi:hypothetical protein
MDVNAMTKVTNGTTKKDEEFTLKPGGFSQE